MIERIERMPDFDAGDLHPINSRCCRTYHVPYVAVGAESVEGIIAANAVRMAGLRPMLSWIPLSLPFVSFVSVRFQSIVKVRRELTRAAFDLFRPLTPLV